MRVHLRRTGVGVEVETRFLYGGMEVQGKLRSIVRLYVGRTVRQGHPTLLQKVRRRRASMIGVCSGKSSALLGVNPREDISLGTVNEPDHGICFQDAVSFGPPELLCSLGYALMEVSGASMERETDRSWQEPAFLEIANGSASEGDRYPISFPVEKGCDLLLAQARMVPPQDEDALDESGRVLTGSSLLGSRAFGIQSVEIASFFLKRCLPPEESAGRDAESVSCRLYSVFLPKRQYLHSSLYFLLVPHMPEA